MESQRAGHDWATFTSLQVNNNSRIRQRKNTAGWSWEDSSKSLLCSVTCSPCSLTWSHPDCIPDFRGQGPIITISLKLPRWSQHTTPGETLICRMNQELCSALDVETSAGEGGEPCDGFGASPSDFSVLTEKDPTGLWCHTFSVTSHFQTQPLSLVVFLLCPETQSGQRLRY